jgi:hypothetical protein
LRSYAFVRVAATRVAAILVATTRVTATLVAAVRVKATFVAAKRMWATFVRPGFSLTCGIVEVAFFGALLPLIKDFFWIAISIFLRDFFLIFFRPNCSLMY